jgi:hypothetical protein
MEENFLITNEEQLLKSIVRLDFLENQKINNILIKLVVSKNMFEKSIKEIINKISFNHIGFLSHIEVIKDDFVIYEEDRLNKVSEFFEDSILKFKIEKDMVLKVYRHLIVLNDVEGTIVLMNEDSMITCNKMIDAKVISIKGNVNHVNGEFMVIKGDQKL